MPRVRLGTGKHYLLPFPVLPLKIDDPFASVGRKVLLRMRANAHKPLKNLIIALVTTRVEAIINIAFTLDLDVGFLPVRNAMLTGS